MKSTGIVRKIDELGRILHPIELRTTLDIDGKDAVEIYVDKDTIILKKFRSSCVFCNSGEDVIDFKGKYVCPECLAQIKKA